MSYDYYSYYNDGTALLTPLDEEDTCNMRRRIHAQKPARGQDLCGSQVLPADSTRVARRHQLLLSSSITSCPVALSSCITSFGCHFNDMFSIFCIFLSKCKLTSMKFVHQVRAILLQLLPKESSAVSQLLLRGVEKKRTNIEKSVHCDMTKAYTRSLIPGSQSLNPNP